MKIIGLMVCGGGEANRYLENTLKEFKRLCDDAVIVVNNGTDAERQMIKRYGFWQYDDNREWGKFQPHIKEDLLNRIAVLKPDWILPLDADEVFLPNVTRQVLEEMTQDKLSCYVYIVNHWDSPDRYMKDLSFWNIRFFKYLPNKTQYQKTPLHCGLAPAHFYYMGTYTPLVLRHFGLMKKDDRMKKIERYNKYDPNARFKARVWYESLASDATGSEFNEEKVYQEVVDDVKKMIHQKKYA